MRDVHGRADDALAIRRREAVDEAPVDLRLRDGQAIQLRERRVAGPEVVERHTHTDASQMREGAHVFLDVRHDEALGHLEHEPFRRDFVHREPARDEIGKLWIGEVTDRDVHGDVQRESSLVPAAALLERSPEHVLGQRFDETAVLRERDERRGEDRPAPRMIPTCERLEAARRAGADVDAGLERDAELVML